MVNIIIIYKNIENKDLKDHIDKVGVVLYEQNIF